MEDQIQFVAKYADWTAIKKLTITEGTRPLDIALFLGSLGETFDRKVEDNVRKFLNLKKVDEFLAENVSTGKKEADISANLAVLNSRNFSKLVNELVDEAEHIQPEGLNDKSFKKEKEAMKELVKVYATRKVLNEAKLSVDFSSVAKILKPPKKGAK